MREFDFYQSARNDFWTSMGGRGWHLDRAQFDASLLQAATEQGATVMRGVQLVGCDELRPSV